MDPISTLTTLVDIAFAIDERFGELQGLLEEERDFANKYKQSVKHLQTEIENDVKVYKAIIVYGEQAAVRSLLNSDDGKTVQEKLSATLDSAKKVLERQEDAVDTLITKLKHREVRFLSSVQSLVLDHGFDEAEDLKNIVQNAYSDLDVQRQEVRATFELFEKLYEVHHLGRQSDKLPPSPTERTSTGDIHMLFEYIDLKFSTHPFHLGVSKDEEIYLANIIKRLNNCTNWKERLTAQMEENGKRWVEDRILDECSFQKCRDLQLQVFRNLLKVVSLDSGTALFTIPDSSDSSLNINRTLLKDINSMIGKSLKQAEEQEYSIAFSGMVKAGKSLFLNAVIGRMLLPSNDLPSTAWPVRVRHVKGQNTPKLEVDTKPFQEAIKHLQRRQFGHKMKGYTPTSDDPFAGIMEGDLHAQALQIDPAAAEYRDIYTKWVDLHPSTKANLELFEGSGFRMNPFAEGVDQVERLLAEVNDVVRICSRFGVRFGSDKAGWPLLTVEFDALKGVNMNGTYEFIDLPGLGENQLEDNFEELVRKVAQEVDVFVPIVSFKEVPKEDWRRLPNLIKRGASRPPDLIVCTHFDQHESRVTELTSRVVKTFWPDHPGRHDRVLKCASTMGLSARALGRLSEGRMPKFEEFWNANGIEYACAAKILGEGNPKLVYREYKANPRSWEDDIAAELQKSGLPQTIMRLTSDMVMKAQQRMLMYDNKVLQALLRRGIDEQKRLILEIRRSERDYELAFREFRELETKYKAALENWVSEEQRSKMDSRSSLTTITNVLRKSGYDRLSKIVKAASNGATAMDHAANEHAESNSLVFNHIEGAEKFVRRAQDALMASLAQLKLHFVTSVRKIVNDYRQKQLKALRTLIQSTIPEMVQTRLKEEIIDNLDKISAHINTILFTSLQRRVVKTVEQRYTAKSAYRSLQNAIATSVARPRRKSRDSATLLDSSDDDEPEKTVATEELGFMLRAPIAAVATIPLVFGVVIWPFLVESRRYAIETSKFEQELRERLVDPFLKELEKEAETTLNSTLDKSSAAAREAVEGALSKERSRYENEKSNKNRPQSKELLATSLATLANFIAADSALRMILEATKSTMTD